ncbi:hypothetical protein L4C31_16500 [Aliivibrio sifiae]
MRLLLVLITIIVSIPSYSEVYNEEGEYVGKDYNTTEAATSNTAIGAVFFLLTKESRDREAIQKSYQIMMDKGSGAIKINTCDDACKAEVQAEVLKKYSFKNQYNKSVKLD